MNRIEDNVPLCMFAHVISTWQTQGSENKFIEINK